MYGLDHLHRRDSQNLHIALWRSWSLWSSYRRFGRRDYPVLEYEYMLAAKHTPQDLGNGLVCAIR